MQHVKTDDFVKALLESDVWESVDSCDPINSRQEVLQESVEETTEPEAAELALELLENISPLVVLEFLDIVREELIIEGDHEEEAQKIDEYLVEFAGALGAAGRGIGNITGAFAGAKTQKRIAHQGAVDRATDAAQAVQKRKGVAHAHGGVLGRRLPRGLGGGGWEAHKTKTKTLQRRGERRADQFRREDFRKALTKARGKGRPAGAVSPEDARGERGATGGGGGTGGGGTGGGGADTTRVASTGGGGGVSTPPKSRPSPKLPKPSGDGEQTSGRRETTSKSRGLPSKPSPKRGEQEIILPRRKGTVRKAMSRVNVRAKEGEFKMVGDKPKGVSGSTPKQIGMTPAAKKRRARRTGGGPGKRQPRGGKTGNRGGPRRGTQGGARKSARRK